MPLSIKNPEVDRLARELARRTGESMTEAILKALRERLQTVTGRQHPIKLADQLDEIARRCASLPVLDDRNDNEILGFDERGIPR